MREDATPEDDLALLAEALEANNKIIKNIGAKYTVKLLAEKIAS